MWLQLEDETGGQFLINLNRKGAIIASRWIDRPTKVALGVNVLEHNVTAKEDVLVHFAKLSPRSLLIDVEHELVFLGLGPGLELLADLLAQAALHELVVDFEVAGGDDLEDGVPVILEV